MSVKNSLQNYELARLILHGYVGWAGTTRGIVVAGRWGYQVGEVNPHVGWLRVGFSGVSSGGVGKFYRYMREGNWK